MVGLRCNHDVSRARVAFLADSSTISSNVQHVERAIAIGASDGATAIFWTGNLFASERFDRVAMRAAR